MSHQNFPFVFVVSVFTSQPVPDDIYESLSFVFDLVSSFPSFSSLSNFDFTLQPNQPFWLNKKQHLTKPCVCPIRLHIPPTPRRYLWKSQFCLWLGLLLSLYIYIYIYVFIYYYLTTFHFCKHYFMCLSYPSSHPTHSQTIFMEVSVLSLIWPPPFLLFLPYPILISHFSQTSLFGSTKSNTLPNQEHYSKSHRLLFEVEAEVEVDTTKTKTYIEHNKSTPLGFVQLLNSFLKISYMATGFIRNKSHFSKGIFRFN